MEQIALQIHITTIFALIGTILYTDHLGLWWMLGKTKTLEHQTLTWLHRAVWTGLIVMISTGSIMFLPLQAYLLTVPAFYAKMGFVAVLFVNAILIGRIMHIATERPFSSLTPAERLPLFISGIVSTLAWIGVITMALILGL